MRLLLALIMLFSPTLLSAPIAFDFDHLAIEVNDVNKSAAFYHDIMMLEEIYDATEKEHIRWFSLSGNKAGNKTSGNRQLHLIQTNNFQSKSIKGVHLSLTTANLERFIMHLKKNKIPFENWQGEKGVSNDRPDSVQQVYLQDPDGYWIEVNNAIKQWSVADNSLGQFSNQLDVGNPKNTGSTMYDPTNQKYTLTGSGTNMWAKEDQMQFVYQRLAGDFILRAQVEFVGKGVDPHRKIGWAVRKNLHTSSPQVTGVVHGDGLTSLQWRPTQAADTEQIEMDIKAPNVIQLERRGNTYILSVAHYGQPFVTIQKTNLDMGDNPYIGLFVCSHNAEVIEKAIFSNVRIITPAATDFQPYRDYIGSNLELMDIVSGNRTIIHRAPNSLQAPNWTHDGKTLIFNEEGKLYNFDLATNKISVLNTGFATDNNNDHVLSWDGKMIAISNHNPADDRRSTAYILPLTGSDKPKQISKTGVGDTYLHGWSPDDKNLIFTGNRNKQWNIVKINIATGKETLLTENDHLDDGSEYSPDGKFIYFNSTRTGTMQIWRMKADGSEPTQITFDKYNDWFPHISPDGKQILILSFMDDINPTDHPFYRHVYLRIMPVDLSKKPKIIAYIYGGQGTINVPSWSPDSKTISFISNTVWEP